MSLGRAVLVNLAASWAHDLGVFSLHLFQEVGQGFTAVSAQNVDIFQVRVATHNKVSIPLKFPLME